MSRYFAIEEYHDRWKKVQSSMKKKGYEFQYVWAEGAAHVERGVERQTLEEAMEWVWKTYKGK